MALAQTPFEIHLTTAPLTAEEEPAFVRLCKTLGGKAVLIELARGEHTQQPMLSTVIHADALTDAQDAVWRLAEAMRREGFRVLRTKIEVPDSCADRFPEARAYGGTYYEWHGKVPFVNGQALRALCEAHRAHLSHNSLRASTGLRFVTLREGASHAHFTERVAALAAALEAGRWPVQKPHAEYCVEDSKMDFDRGWLTTPSTHPRISDEDLPGMLACEAFIRRAACVEAPFMLKGSYLTRQFFADPAVRTPADLDYILTQPALTEDAARTRLDDWALAVTAVRLGDGLEFRHFSENQFWRHIDYAMVDDFPTVNTDLLCWVDGDEVEISVDVSFNLPVQESPAPVHYQPLRGEPFVVPRTAPIGLQAAWKIHQTLVRPRFKDLFDLMHLLRHPTFDADARTACMQALADECAADGVDLRRLAAFRAADLSALFADVHWAGQWDYWRWGRAPESHSLAVLGGAGTAARITDASALPKTLEAFRQDFAGALRTAGLHDEATSSLPPPRPTTRVKLQSPSNSTSQPFEEPVGEIPAKPAGFLGRLFSWLREK